MSARYGIRTTLRAKGRSLLFTLLILVLTLALTLGLGMWGYSDGTLRAMDGQYTSIALLEYMGTSYPDPDAADPYARAALAALDTDALAALDGVVSWSPHSGYLAALPGYNRVEGTIPYENRIVVAATGFSPIQRITDYYTVDGQRLPGEPRIVGYTCRFTDTLFDGGRNAKLAIVEAGDSGFAPEKGESYLLHGMYNANAMSGNPEIYLIPLPGGGPAYQNISGADDPALTAGPFPETAKLYEAALGYVRVTASDTPQALEEFQQGLVRLASGRFPEPGEAGVCVLDGRTAGVQKLAVGDSVSLTLLTSQEDDRFALALTGEEKTLEIVGITAPSEDWAGQLWVSAAEGVEAPLFGFQLGEAVLRNDSGSETAEAIAALVPEGVRVTLYDQGYSAAAEPLRTMRTTALAITLTSLCAVLTVLVLFAFLFVGRQRETFDTLTLLGTPKGKIRIWLLSGACLITAFSAALGAALGRVSLSRFIDLAFSAAQGLYDTDLRYSESAMGMTLQGVDRLELPPWPAPAAAAIVFVGSALLCAAFLTAAQRRAAPKRGKLKVRVPKGGTSAALRGPLRFALLSIRRNGLRSAAVPAAALVLSLLLGLLSATASGWQSQVDTLRDTAVIEGQLTSANGRQATNLTVKGDALRTLWKSGCLSDLAVSTGWSYWLPEEIPAFGEGSFAQETRQTWIGRQPKLYAATALSAVPAFYYAGQPEITWLEGWDEGFLLDENYYAARESVVFWSHGKTLGGRDLLTYPCVAGKGFLESHGLALGDTFSVSFIFPHLTQTAEGAAQLMAVGSYTERGDPELVVPMAFWLPPDILTREEDPIPQGERPPSGFSSLEEMEKYYFSQTPFSAARFTLRSPRELTPLREYLDEKGFSEVGRLRGNRVTAVLHDQTFTETVNGLERYISFSGLLTPALYGTVALLGFILSWLMINGRRMEFAVLRGLGASKGRVFLSFFLEQAILAASGCAIGAAILRQPLSAALFLLSYLAGCALSVLLVGRTNLMDLLSERE